MNEKNKFCKLYLMNSLFMYMYMCCCHYHFNDWSRRLYIFVK